MTTNLPFDEWTGVFGSERLTGALLDRLTHHVHILEMNGESYRLNHSRESTSSQAEKARTTSSLRRTFSPPSTRPHVLLSAPSWPLFTLRVDHHSAATVVHDAAALDTPVKTEEKSNAIIDIPRLPEMLELNGCIVTIDAMGYQKEIAQGIVDHGADIRWRS